MKSKTGLLILLAAVSLTACQAYPTKPGDLVKMYKAHPNVPGIHIDKFVVDRPMSRVAAFVKHKAYACLDIQVQYTERGDYGGTTVSTATFKPHATSSPRKDEVYLTKSWSKTDVTFPIIADYFPLPHGKTRVELYYAWGGETPRIAKAFTLWSKGESVGCPDLT